MPLLRDCRQKRRPGRVPENAETAPGRVFFLQFFSALVILSVKFSGSTPVAARPKAAPVCRRSFSRPAAAASLSAAETRGFICFGKGKRNVGNLFEKLRRTKGGRIFLRLLPLLGIVLAIVIFELVEAAHVNAAKPKGPEVEYSEDLEEKRLCYFDVVRIEPVYSISVSGFTATEPMNLVCECRTPDGSVVWLSITPDDYKECFDPNARFGFNASFQALAPRDRRIHGYTRAAENVQDGLRYKTGAETVVEFQSVSKTGS